TQAQEDRLAEIERRDGVFPDIDPGLWVAGAHQTRPEIAPPAAAPTLKRPAPPAKPRPVSHEEAERTAAETTKFDGTHVEQGVTHSPKKKSYPSHCLDPLLSFLLSSLKGTCFLPSLNP